MATIINISNPSQINAQKSAIFGQIYLATNTVPNQYYSGNIQHTLDVFPYSAILSLTSGSSFITAVANTASVTLSVVAGTLSATSLVTGTVTAVSVASSNGFAGSSSGGATPILTLSTTISGLLKGNGTAISAATAADITGQLLTGYVSGAGTVAATDSILQAIQKLNGNTSALVTGVSSVNSLTGAVALTGTANRITISAANIFDIGTSVVTLTGAQALTNKTGLISQWTNDSGYLTTTGITPSNVTAASTKITLAGTPTGAALQAFSIDVDETKLTISNMLGTLAVNHGGTGGTSASITLFNNITGYTASGATGTTSTNLVFSTSPTIVTPTIASFANSNHDHTNSAGGGQLSITGATTGTLTAARGGTGQDTSASTGIAQVTAGTWSVSTALASGTTATTQSTNDNSTKVATTAYADIQATENLIKGYQYLGSTIKAIPLGVGIDRVTSNANMSNLELRLIPVWIPYTQTITGVKWWQITAGVYTSTNYNGVGLYSYSAGTLTLVASSTDDGAIWKATGGTIASKAFSSTYSAVAGLYYIGILWCRSAVTTTPALGVTATVQGSPAFTIDFTNSAKLSGFVSSLSALPSPTQAMSGVSAASTFYFYFALY